MHYQEVGSGSPASMSQQPTGFQACESMDLKNDPRFFTQNVIDKRLGAFAGLAVVSGLMVQNAMEATFEMRKDLNFSSLDGGFQALGFVLLCFVLAVNILSTYIGVIQPYHTYRLMTSGPAGFETAAAYYLHKDIVSWRHFSVKCMLLSMPIFIIASGFRFVVKFERDAMAERPLPAAVPVYVRVEGLVCFVSFIALGLGLLLIHWRHEHIFGALYDTMYRDSGIRAIMSDMDTMMSGSVRRHPLDV